ncbi:MAG: FKBP-type peptidyl-prolyl cis-trans isomerase [Isosphaeraceae bacterium]|nr:FKBP-type peptidyl-prolyl cis-trans isomerase [Isosphaeraceae bacterium]
MKYLMAAAATLGLLAVSALAQEPKAKDAPKASTDAQDLRQKASYALGQNIGDSMRKQSIGIDADALARGLKDGLADKGQFTEHQIREVLTAFQEDIASKKSKADGDFLEANKTKPGVKTTASGLQYKVLKEGTGASPKATDTVSVNYKGTLVDGTEFDSSYKRGEPTEFPVNRVIPGWTEGLQLMKVGSKFEFFIPAKLAYGDRPPPGSKIGPGATLVFEVELLGIK